MPKFIRFKLEGARVLEIDVSVIQLLNIEICDDGEYVLLAWSATQMYELVSGTFDECHHLLNQLHDILGIELIDI